MRTTVIKLLLLVLSIGTAPALAEVAGRVTNISGPLFAVKGDGSRRVLSVSSTVEQGDTLVTENKTYAKVKFIDQAEVTLKPGSQMRIDNFNFDQKAPEKDSAVFGLLKGALRTITGLVGKRGNQDAYRLQTATATIGIRGTVFGATNCVAGSCSGLPDGTYVDVIDGKVMVAPPPPPPAPPGVSLPPSPPPPPPIVLSAGQFGFVPPAGPPQQLPSDPGVAKSFNPPASFQSSGNNEAQKAPGSEGKPQGQQDNKPDKNGDKPEESEQDKPQEKPQQEKKECVVR
jgi:hypothetical protein